MLSGKRILIFCKEGLKEFFARPLPLPAHLFLREPILPSHVKIAAGIGGLTKDSVLLCEQIRVIDRKRLVRKLGNIGEENLQKLGVTLKVILGLE